MMAEPNTQNHFCRQQIIIHDEPERRIDKYREKSISATKLFPATIRDAGGDIRAVAKITTCDVPEVREGLKRTGNIHRSLDDHPNITKVYGIHEIDDRIILLMEEGLASLRDINRPQTPEMTALRDELFATKTKKEIIRDLVQPLIYVHSSKSDVTDKISHRDIKPENLLLSHKDRDGSLGIKLADFDSSKKLYVDEDVVITDGVFTEKYLDPHIADKKAEGQTVTSKEYLGGDMYSLALTIHEVLTGGEYLFQGKTQNETKKKVLDNDRSNLMKSNIDELAKNLIYTLSQKEPEARISAEESDEHPFFKDDNFHIQALRSINEALVGLDKDDPKTKEIKDALNESFFMVFDSEWQKLPFVAPETLLQYKYSSLMEACLRYSRNMMAHTEQYKESFIQHFGSALASHDLLQKMLISMPRMLIHFYWFAKKYLPDLACVTSFPQNCAVAYEESMKEQREKIGASFKEMFARVCPQPVAAASVDEHGALQEAFGQLSKQIKQLVDESERDFKNYKMAVKDWERKKQQLVKVVENKKASGRSKAEIEKTEKSVEQHMETQLPLKWMLDVRDLMRNPEKIQEIVKTEAPTVVNAKVPTIAMVHAGVQVGNPGATFEKADVAAGESEDSAKETHLGTQASDIEGDEEADLLHSELSQLRGEIVRRRLISSPSVECKDWSTSDRWPVGYGFVAHRYKNEIYVWGGSRGYISSDRLPRDIVYIFNPEAWRLSWRRMKVTGCIPEFSVQCASGLLNDTIYIFGGSRGGTKSNQIHALSLSTGVATRLSVVGASPSPREECEGWFHHGKFYIYGGQTVKATKGDKSLVGDRHHGRSDNLLCRFDPALATWSKVGASGGDVKPRYDYAAAKIGHYVYIHGGYSDGFKSNNLSMLDMRTMNWTLLSSSGPARGRHSLTPFALKRFLLIGDLNDEKGVWTLDWGNPDSIWQKSEESLPTGMNQHRSVAVKTKKGFSIVCMGGCNAPKDIVIFDIQ